MKMIWIGLATAALGVRSLMAGTWGDDLKLQVLPALAIKATVAASTMTPLTQMMAACALSAVIVVALWQSGQDGGSVGGFVAFVMAMLQLVTPIKHLSEVAGPITRGMAALERGVRLVDETPAELGGGHAPARCRGELELQQVGLHYPDAATAALDGVSMALHPGETVDLAGYSVRLDGVEAALGGIPARCRDVAPTLEEAMVLREQ